MHFTNELIFVIVRLPVFQLSSDETNLPAKTLTILIHLLRLVMSLSSQTIFSKVLTLKRKTNVCGKEYRKNSNLARMLKEYFKEDKMGIKCGKETERVHGFKRRAV